MKYHLIDIQIKFIYIYILFKFNYILYEIHKYVNFKICIEKVLRPEYFNFEIRIIFFLNDYKLLKLFKISHYKFCE